MWKETRTKQRVLKPLQATVSILFTWEGKNTILRDSLEKEMATHSSVLAWRIPWTEEPGGLLSIGSHRVGLDWSDLACMHAFLDKKMATHSSILAWRIPGTEEPGGLPSVGSHRVRHDWYDLAAAAAAAKDSKSWIFLPNSSLDLTLILLPLLPQGSLMWIRGYRQHYSG